MMTATEKKLTAALRTIDPVRVLRLAGISTGYIQNGVEVAKEGRAYRVVTVTGGQTGAVLGTSGREAMATIRGWAE